MPGWAADPRIVEALEVLPRTLVHGDMHSGNIIVGEQGAGIIDWGNARAGPAYVDLENIISREESGDSSKSKRMRGAKAPRWPRRRVLAAGAKARFMCKARRFPIALPEGDLPAGFPVAALLAVRSQPSAARALAARSSSALAASRFTVARAA